ncbi:undecaprenyl-diphosphatase [Mesorhizobium sp. SB112]|uniref:undecaprenyl-diphosphatase n=1 Tax=Mesorhizobium sp. SB112 TaxID=3151853 RepID=UPI003267E9E7
MNQADQAVFLLLNAGSETWGLTAYIAYFFAKYVIFLIPVHLAVLWFVGNRSVRRQALILLSALIIAIGTSYLIGAIYDSPRPFLIPIGNTLIEHRSSPSFPSNHGLVMFTYAITMALLAHWKHALAIGLAGILVAWSRIYMGVHFPLDMIGGAIIAAGASYLAMRLDKIAGRPAIDLADAVYRLLAVEPASRLAERFRK